MAAKRDLYLAIALLETFVEDEFFPGGRLDVFCGDHGVPPGELGKAIQRLGQEAGMTEAGWDAAACEEWESSES